MSSIVGEGRDDRPDVQALFGNLTTRLPELEKLLVECSDHWSYEDPVYRFYHQSFKAYGLQQTTCTIVEELQKLAPGRTLNVWFRKIAEEGSGKVFSPDHNRTWLQVTRPILEAFFHARFFLEMAVKYGKELDFPPRCMPSGWAALLYLYDLR